MKTTTKNLTLSAMCLALCIVLPYLTGNNYHLGSMLLLMHIPVLLCGFACGWQWGLAIGFIAPLLRSLLIGAPPLLNTAIAMAFELAAYGAFAGLLYAWLQKAKLKFLSSLSGPIQTTVQIYIALILSMLLGRIVWGVAQFGVYSLFIPDKVFTMAAFVSGAFVLAWPGILIQLAMIPPVVLALKRLRFAA